MLKTLRPIKNRGTAVISTNPTSNGFTTIAGTDNPESQMKLKNLEKIEGKELLGLTKNEEMQLQEILDKWITNE